jgi:hypothetical protein
MDRIHVAYLKYRFILLLLVITFILSVYYCIEFPVVPGHDYVTYTLNWDHILSGGDPWLGAQPDQSIPQNVYGPIYLLFAYPYSIYNKLPRIIWTLFWYGLSYWLIIQIFNFSRLNENYKIILSMVLLLSPFLWITTVYFAHFDIVVAVLSLSSIEAKRRARNVMSGILISMAVSLKYYPIVIVPFLFISKKKVDIKFITSFILFTAIIFVTSYGIWKDSLFIPIKIAAARPSKLLSIFRFLRGEYSFLKLCNGINNVDIFSLPLLIISGGTVFIIYLIKNMDFITGSVLAVTVTLLFYKVGHYNYHMILYLFLIYWIIFTDFSKWVSATAIIIYMLFINLFQIGYMKFLWGGKWSFVRDICGLPAFFVIAFLLFAVFWDNFHSVKQVD